MADVNTGPQATPLLLGLWQLVSADLCAREFAFQFQDDFLSRAQVGIGGQDGQILQLGLRADRPFVVVDVNHLEFGCCTGALAERNPAVDVVLCVLVVAQHFVVLLTAFPFAGGKRAE